MKYLREKLIYVQELKSDFPFLFENFTKETKLIKKRLNWQYCVHVANKSELKGKLYCTSMPSVYRLSQK